MIIPDENRKGTLSPIAYFDAIVPQLPRLCCAPHSSIG
jgi:hypothetical protein